MDFTEFLATFYITPLWCFLFESNIKLQGIQFHIEEPRGNIGQIFGKGPFFGPLRLGPSFFAGWTDHRKTQGPQWGSPYRLRTNLVKRADTREPPGRLWKELVKLTGHRKLPGTMFCTASSFKPFILARRGLTISVRLNIRHERLRHFLPRLKFLLWLSYLDKVGISVAFPPITVFTVFGMTVYSIFTALKCYAFMGIRNDVWERKRRNSVTVSFVISLFQIWRLKAMDLF